MEERRAPGLLEASLQFWLVDGGGMENRYHFHFLGVPVLGEDHGSMGSGWRRHGASIDWCATRCVRSTLFHGPGYLATAAAFLGCRREDLHRRKLQCWTRSRSVCVVVAFGPKGSRRTFVWPIWSESKTCTRRSQLIWRATASGDFEWHEGGCRRSLRST